MQSLKISFLTFAVLSSIVHAELYVTEPLRGYVCHAGQDCLVRWVDDGVNPLLDGFGVSTVGLYTGHMQLVQVIEPVDVSQKHSLVFKPIPEAGPNSDAYYVAFTSANLIDEETSLPALSFSPYFTIDGMTGSFDEPLDSATSEIPIPASLSPSATAPPSPSGSGSASGSRSSSASQAANTSPAPSPLNTNGGNPTKACPPIYMLGFLSAVMALYNFL